MDITDGFLDYLESREYKKKYINKLQYGLKYVLKHNRFEDILLHISNLPYAKAISEDLRNRYSDDISKLALSALRRLREFLINKGIVEDRLRLRTDGYFGEIEKKLHVYITNEMNYCQPRADRLVKEYVELVAYLHEIGKSDFSGISAADIFGHFKARQPCMSLASNLRVLLKFLYREGYLKEDFSPIVLTTRRPDNEIRKFLPAEDVEKLLNSIDRSSSIGKRNYVFFLLMARLAMRGTEINRLRLDDLDWHKSRIFVRGKHDQESWLPMSKEIGDALFDYLNNSKRIDSEYILLSEKPPFDRLLSTQKFSYVLREMYEKSGVKCPTKRMTINVFRHSFATDVLNKGKTIQEVQNLMRHEDIVTTMIYAKYDLASLSGFAAEWPGEKP